MVQEIIHLVKVKSGVSIFTIFRLFPIEAQFETEQNCLETLILKYLMFT